MREEGESLGGCAHTPHGAVCTQLTPHNAHPRSHIRETIVCVSNTHTHTHTQIPLLSVKKKGLVPRPEQQTGGTRSPSRRFISRGVGPSTGSAYTRVVRALVWEHLPGCVSGSSSTSAQSPLKTRPCESACVCAHKYILPGSIFGSGDSPGALEWIMQDEDSPRLLRSSHSPSSSPWICKHAAMGTREDANACAPVWFYGQRRCERLERSQQQPSGFSCSRRNSLTLVVNSYRELFINLLLAWTINY